MSDAEVLSEEESEALLEQSEAADSSTGGILDPGDDFWEQVAPDRIPGLDAVDEEIADALSRIWVRMFRREIVVSAQPARRANGRAVARSIASEESAHSFDIQGRDEQCLLVLGLNTISSMVDLCFGGNGAGGRSERLAGLTEMERRLLARFCDEFRDRVTDIWRKRANISLQHSAEAFSVSGHALCDSGAHVVTSRFVFDVAQSEHAIDLVWPAALVDILRERRPQALPAAKQRPELEWSTRLREELRGARIEVRAVIGGIPLRLHQISSAKTGDVIMTEPLDKVCLFAGDQPVFEGTLGTHNGLNAVKISQPFARRRSGDA